LRFCIGGIWTSRAIAGAREVAQNSEMMDLPAEVAPARAHSNTDPIRFEQPLTERMRTFLRIEFLYRQATFHAGDPTDFGARAAVASLLEILAIVGRGDVRADVLKELDRHAELLGNYRHTPGVDAERLNGLIGNVDELRSQLTASGKQFMTALKENEFLTTIKHRSAIPGGTCMFDLPDYGYWLHRPQRERGQQLTDWLTQLKPLCDAVAEVLWLTREASEPIKCVATAGLYHHSLNKSEQLNLVRVLLPAKAGLFPEISAGQHRFTVRFAQWRGVDQRPAQVSDDVQFLLALC
jgi:cell division protein ZapD